MNLVYENLKKKEKNYICSCGKKYFSNAALFTHVKLKHQGNPPGPVSKPKSFYQKKGRPSLQTKLMKMKQKILITDTQESTNNKQISLPNSDSYDKYEQIFSFLEQIQSEQLIDPKIWSQVQSFKEIYKYINCSNEDNNKKTPFEYYGVRMGVGLSQFLRTISLRLQKHKFQQVVVILTLLVQYIMDQNNKKQIMSEAPIQFILEYTNTFVNFQLENIKQDFQVEKLWIIRRQNAIKVLYCFLNWLIYKKYTTYSINKLPNNCQDDLI